MQDSVRKPNQKEPSPGRAIPHASKRLTIAAPLVPLAQHARSLTFVGLILISAAVFSQAYGQNAWAVVVLTAGASIIVLVGISVILITRWDRRLRRDVEHLSRIYANDPGAIVLTDGFGRALAANEAAGQFGGPAQRLKDWSVDPEAMVQSILSDVKADGVFSQEIRQKNNSLEVVSHVSGLSGSVLVWRFTARDHKHPREMDALGAPMITDDGATISVNSAAQDMGSLEFWRPISREIDEQIAESATELSVSFPTGEVAQAHRIPSRDGLADTLFLPPHKPSSARTTPYGMSFEDIPVALVELDLSGKIAETNRLARSLLALGAHENRFFWQVVEGLGRPVADWLKDARSGRALGRPEILRATLAGAETYVQIILRRMSGDAQLVAVISDATELKSLEARFVQSQKMQAIGQLAGGIAHDFNNLLTAISGHCDLLLMNRDRFDPDYNDLLQIHQNSNRAAALVRQLLAFSRKQTMKPETLKLESLLEELTHLLTRLVGERITLTLEHDPSLTAIRADRRQLEQVIMNLVVNARDAMPMGGNIRIKTEAKVIEVEEEIGRARLAPGAYAMIRVIDEGVGIPSDIIDKIFEPFFTTKRLGEGTGLGLSTAYGIVKQMGGYIFAQSVEGSGTEFSLYFAALSASELGREAQMHSTLSPEKSKDQAVQSAGHLPAPHSAAEARVKTEQLGETVPVRPEPPTKNPRPVMAEKLGNTVLLVEDEAPVRAFAARALRLQGYQVFEAQDGEQALEFLEDKSLRIDVFVTDVVMPGIDGPGWVTQALAHRPGTPVVFVSGYTEDSLSEALSRIPKAVFLGKPFSLHELSSAIDAQLSV